MTRTKLFALMTAAMLFCLPFSLAIAQTAKNQQQTTLVINADIVTMDVSPFTTPTLAGALKKISKIQPDKDGWIVAFGADQTLYEEKRGPTRDLLDPLFPDTPVIVFHISGHGAFMNSEALRISGLDETVPDPTGGFFEKDKDGKLTGYLSGQPAFLPYKAYPNATHEAAVEKSKLSAKFGVTTGSELAIMNAFVLEAVHEAVQDPEYATRLIGGYFSTAPDYKEIVPLLKNYETDLFRIPFIKTWTDGSLQGGTAYLRHGYHDKTMGEGDSAQGSQEYFNELVLDIYQRGFWPAIHANGDGAVDVALNALENAKKKMGPARKTSSGRVVGASQAITPEQALAAYTINAAYQFGMEKDVGSLEVGKFADFVVLDSNPIKIDPLKIRDIQIVATVMGGRITYSDTPPYDRVTPIKW